MAQTIKTRHTERNIKSLDKTVNAADRMKRSYMKAKDSAEQTQGQEGSPVEYAEDRMTHGADRAAHEGAHQIRERGERTLHHVKDRREAAGEIKQRKPEVKKGRSATTEGERSSFSPAGGEKDYQPKQQISKNAKAKAQKKAAQRQAEKTAQGAGRNAVQAEKAQQQVRRAADGERKAAINASRVEKTVKPTGKGSIKRAGKTIKGAEKTAGTTVKTAEQAAAKAKKAAQASVKAARKSAKAARETAKATERTAKATVRAAVRAAKAIAAATKTLVTAIVAGGWVVLLILIIVILFGAALCSMGGDNSNAVSPVSEEVKAYEPVIRKYAKQYGILEYVELIKAVMMQESGGTGNDPMQSSEGSFNTKYPRKPNGITDPEYSIDCGVQELKNCLERAKVESPVDMEHIKLALQGYNYGNGYIEWADKNYGGYTLANAAEFSDKMAKKKKLPGYGDKQYVPHVLRYYAFGRSPSGAGSQMIVQVALAQEGSGGTAYWKWYGFSSRQPWCACFASWCADQCGYIENGTVPKFSLCSDGVKQFQSRKQFQDASHVPSPGDYIFFDWGDDGSIDHVGIVEKAEKGTVYTIEGNSSDKVRRHSYKVGSDSIYGYGCPCY